MLVQLLGDRFTQIGKHSQRSTALTSCTVAMAVVVLGFVLSSTVPGLLPAQAGRTARELMRNAPTNGTLTTIYIHLLARSCQVRPIFYPS